MTGSPGGLCWACGDPMQWTFIAGEVHVRCDGCYELDFGMELAGATGDGHEAKLPDGRPCRSLLQIAQSSAFCEGG